MLFRQVSTLRAADLPSRFNRILHLHRPGWSFMPVLWRLKNQTWPNLSTTVHNDYLPIVPIIPMTAPVNGSNDLVRCSQLHFTTSLFASSMPFTNGSTLLNSSNRNSSLFVGTMKAHVNGSILIVVTPASANTTHDFFLLRFLTDV